MISSETVGLRSRRPQVRILSGAPSIYGPSSTISPLAHPSKTPLSCAQIRKGPAAIGPADWASPEVGPTPEPVEPRPYAVRLIHPPVWMGPELHWVDTPDQALRFPTIAVALRYAIEERGFRRDEVLVAATSVLP